MHAAAMRLEMHIPLARSLKDKRAALRPVVEGIRRSVSVSVAEVGHHDAWQRATLGIALVAPDARHLERLIGDVRRYLDQCLEVEVLATGISYLEAPEEGFP